MHVSLGDTVPCVFAAEREEKQAEEDSFEDKDNFIWIARVGDIASQIF